MNAKITARAWKEMQGKLPEDRVSLKLRITTPFTTEEFLMLTAWGGNLLYDNGCMALLNLPVGKVNDIAVWETVVEVL